MGNKNIGLFAAGLAIVAGVGTVGVRSYKKYQEKKSEENSLDNALNKMEKNNDVNVDDLFSTEETTEEIITEVKIEDLFEEQSKEEQEEHTNIELGKSDFLAFASKFQEINKTKEEKKDPETNELEEPEFVNGLNTYETLDNSEDEVTIKKPSSEDPASSEYWEDFDVVMDAPEEDYHETK